MFIFATEYPLSKIQAKLTIDLYRAFREVEIDECALLLAVLVLGV